MKRKKRRKILRFLGVNFILYALAISMIPLPGVNATKSGQQIGDFIVDDDGYAIEYTGTGNEMTIPEGVVGIGWDFKTFLFHDPDEPEDNKIRILNIPASFRDFGFYEDKEGSYKADSSDIFGHASSLKWINIAEDNPEYKSYDGAIYSKDMKEVLYYPTSRTDDIIIPDGVQEIWAGAIENCDNIIVSIPDSVSKMYSWGQYFSLGNVKIACNRGSYAEFYARNNDVVYFVDGDMNKRHSVASDPNAAYRRFIPSLQKVKVDGEECNIRYLPNATSDSTVNVTAINPNIDGKSEYMEVYMVLEDKSGNIIHDFNDCEVNFCPPKDWGDNYSEWWVAVDEGNNSYKKIDSQIIKGEYAYYYNNYYINFHINGNKSEDKPNPDEEKSSVVSAIIENSSTDKRINADMMSAEVTGVDGKVTLKVGPCVGNGITSYLIDNIAPGETVCEYIELEMHLEDENGNTINNFEKCEVQFPMPDSWKGAEARYWIATITDSGIFERIDASTRIRDGIEYIVFTTRHFSNYVIVREAYGTNNNYNGGWSDGLNNLLNEINRNDAADVYIQKVDKVLPDESNSVNYNNSDMNYMPKTGVEDLMFLRNTIIYGLFLSGTIMLLVSFKKKRATIRC